MTTTIRIGPITYSIEEVTDLKNSKGVAVDGLVDTGKAIIRVEKDAIGGQVKFLTILHEIVHVIMMQAGMDDTLSEESIDVIAYGVMGLITHNQDAIVQLLNENGILSYSR